MISKNHKAKQQKEQPQRGRLADDSKVAPHAGAPQPTPTQQQRPFAQSPSVATSQQQQMQMQLKAAGGPQLPFQGVVYSTQLPAQGVQYTAYPPVKPPLSRPPSSSFAAPLPYAQQQYPQQQQYSQRALPPQGRPGSEKPPGPNASYYANVGIQDIQPYPQQWDPVSGQQ
jgi:hypothetical protein